MTVLSAGPSGGASDLHHVAYTVDIHFRGLGLKSEEIKLSIWKTTEKWYLDTDKKLPIDDQHTPDSVAKLVNRWIGACEANHSMCFKEAVPPKTARMPARLLDLGGSVSNTWPNYHNFLDYQPDDILPQTYKEIIAICRSIAVRYLWIDSLCIIQDYGGLEFRKKAPLMTDIYQYAFLTLTILWDFPGLSVFRKCRPRSIPRHKPAASYNQQDSTCQTDEYVFVEHRDALDLQVAVDLAPLNKRAWVLQERCLSRRLLYLGNEQVFESVMNVLAVRYLQLCNILHPEGPTQSVTLWLTYQDLIETPIGVGSFRDILDTI
ncbi:hypothetical protein FPOAC1_007113 [Fusarium poae]|uniref:hypothetical protein n=1 Tax=Fusarium poae TaxID=36050 RepID=UPI001CEA2D02|nr:hypothetical protein FPOAC1_007113 [Fusarium poae]KAG8673794.1 hypothetical protein FPOAC1_007113 [Fusarium poae]